MFAFSVPLHIKLECSSIEETAKNIVNGVYEKPAVLILISSLEDLEKLVKKIKEFSKEYSLPAINIGGIRHCGNKKMVYKALCLDEHDINLIKHLCSLGIILEYYLLPGDHKIVLNDVISEIEDIVKKDIKK